MTKVFVLRPIFSAILATALYSFGTVSAVAQTQTQPTGTVNCNRNQACAFTLSPEHNIPVTFSLSVTADVKAAPDMAKISFATATIGRTADEALNANNKKMSDVLSAIKSLGIESKNIQTSNLNLTPQYLYAENQPPKITGYQVTDQISVRIENLSNLGPVIDAVTKAGVNQIDSVVFDIKNDDLLLDQARQDAVLILNKRAQLYAKTLGFNSAVPMSLSEGGVTTAPIAQQPIFMTKRTDFAPTPISSGELERSITLNAVFELKK